MINKRFMRSGTIAAFAIAAATAAAPAGAQAAPPPPPPSCTLTTYFAPVGSATAPTKIVASAYYACSNGIDEPDGEVYIERSVSGGLPVAVASGEPSAVYFCNGTAVHSYTNNATLSYITVPCG